MFRRDVRVMISAEEIFQRVQELGLRIGSDYLKSDLVVVGLLNGVYPFFADLTRAIDLDFPIGFMRVSSYGAGRVSSGDVKIIHDIEIPIRGKSVLIVEDIVDTGLTLDKVLKHLQKQSPASLRVCALLDKPARRVVDLPVDYAGFTISDQFVVGYGMDANGLYRNLPYIGEVIAKPDENVARQCDNS